MKCINSNKQRNAQTMPEMLQTRMMSMAGFSTVPVMDCICVVDCICVCLLLVVVGISTLFPDKKIGC